MIIRRYYANKQFPHIVQKLKDWWNPTIVVQYIVKSHPECAVFKDNKCIYTGDLSQDRINELENQLTHEIQTN